MLTRNSTWNRLLGRIVVPALIFMMVMAESRAQEMLFRDLDSAMAKLEHQESWRALLITGKHGLDQGFDYKALHYRMGVAAYSLENYRAASLHFRKALGFDGDNPIIRAYLFYSLIQAYEPELAFYYAAGEATCLKPLAGIYAEGGVKVPNQTDSLSPLVYGHILLVHQLDKRLSFRQGFTYVVQEYLGLPYRHPQYYLSMGLVVTPVLIIKPAIHLAAVKGQQRYFYEQDGNPVRLDYELNRTISMASMEIQIKWGRLSIEPMGMHAMSTSQYLYSYMISGQGQGSQSGKVEVSPFEDKTRTTQVGMNISFCPPIQSESIYLSAGVFHHQSGNLQDWIYQASMRLRNKYKHEFRLTWMQAKLPFTMEENGRYLYNSPAIAKQRIRLTAKAPITNKLSLYLVGAHEKMQEKTFTFDYYSAFLGLEFNL